MLASLASVSAQESSIFIDKNIEIPKQHWQSQSFFVHENIYINPFNDYQIIVEKDGNNILKYKVWGKDFSPTHSLYISQNDSELKKTFQEWKKKQEWIFTKIILQEATYEVIDGIITPRQTVAATRYYRVEYNYDSSAPICEKTFFSEDISGNKKIDPQGNFWFNKEKYAFFLCSDVDSSCHCDETDTGCFVKDERVFSSPILLSHKQNISSTFSNNAWEAVECRLQDEEIIYYDTLTPDLDLYINNTLQNFWNSKEYVSNNNILYDGVQIKWKNLYHIWNTYSFFADKNTSLRLELVDPYDSSLQSEGVSWVYSYHMSLAKNIDGIWQDIWSTSDSFEPYNLDGSKQQKDIRSISLEDIDFVADTLIRSGKYQLYIEFRDFAWNVSRASFNYTIVPNQVDGQKSFVKPHLRNSVYADGTDFYEYSLVLRDRYDNPITEKQVYNFIRDCSIVGDCKTLRQNMLPSSPEWIEVIEIYDIESASDIWGDMNFKVRSLAPGVFTEVFSFQIYEWDARYNNVATVRNVEVISWENTFLQPFSGILESRSWGSWGMDFPIHQDARFRLRLIENTAFPFNGSIADFSTDIWAYDTASTSITLSWALSQAADNTMHFNARVSTTLSPDEYQRLGMQIEQGGQSSVQISYVLKGIRIEYYLSSSAMWWDPISLMKESVFLQNPVRILWKLQGSWNAQNNFERQNISAINSGNIRNTLRKNIISYTRSMSHGDVLAGVKYIDGEELVDNVYQLESDPNFETLVVRNGNIHINKDFNVAGKKVWIMVYKDTWYDVLQDYADLWNIYIDAAVSEVHAFIYADGALISSKNVNPIAGDVITRGEELENQIFIKWAIFSRNTLWWATQKAGKYALPGSAFTTNQDIAAQYDLHHLRRWNENCIWWGACLYNEYTIIEYDPRIQTSPPALFSQ